MVYQDATGLYHGVFSNSVGTCNHSSFEEKYARKIKSMNGFKCFARNICI